MKLSDLIENPDNPQTVTDEDFTKLVESLREDAVMLEVRPVAFVTDYVSPVSDESFAGRRVILDGCKRHRALVAIHGPDAELPDRYFKDLTPFPPEARRRWVVKANVQTGDWDVDKLLKLYSSDELADLLLSDEFEELIGELERGKDAKDMETEATEESREFEEKFVPKRTTDDCYTPDCVFAAVLDWAANRYGFDKSKIVRPFFPGGDYLNATYPDGYTVVDNPPFSIYGEICRFYLDKKIPFFLFGPALTLSSGGNKGATYIIANYSITYANGAKVATSFVTNLDPENVIVVAPDLRDAIKLEDDRNRAKMTREVKSHEYPDCVCSCARLGYLANHHTPLVIRRESAVYIRELDAQKESGDGIFGGGFLLSVEAAAEKAAAEKAAAEKAAAEKAAAEKAAAEKAAAAKWELSPREIELQKTLR